MSEGNQLSFEEAIQRLSKIVDQLEGGELPLEVSLALFEEGVRLTRQSQAKLDAAERRIEELLEVTNGGEPVTRPMSLRDG
ncbi:MAG: exodeoxyribonuclease VII small subunit [Myxococcales bacterium]|nr:exodeoxyribonuclease VII small subunit [Polyangiaceae bacterium]MDW8248132.1 exodeoxyribonuclease VII small subunit [Myxococcales bacterium]